MEPRQKELLTAAAECAENAFCFYSKQRMGVCVIGTDGKIYRGKRQKMIQLRIRRGCSLFAFFLFVPA